MPPNEGPSDVTGCKFSSQGSDCTQNDATTKSKAQRLAEKLDQHGGIPLLKATLDGANISYTTLKYFFDALNSNPTISSSDTMHAWMLTPEGIAIAALESVFLISFSMLANYLQEYDDYDLCFMKPGTRIKKNKIYVQVTEAGLMRYTVKTPSGAALSSVITSEELGVDLVKNKPTTQNELQTYLPKILEITLKRGHTQKPTPRLFNRYLMLIWPYFRDSLKGLKNSYKGMNSLFRALSLLELLEIQNLNLMLV